MFRSRTTNGLILLTLVALVLRVATVWLLDAQVAGPITYEHGEIAENLLAGKGFTVRYLGVTGPTSQQAPLYPALLAGLYAIFGVGSHAAILVMQLLQCLAGTGVVLAVVWLAWSLLPEQRMIGWLAGWGAALYPTHVYMVTHIQVATWAALVLTLLVGVAVSPRWHGRFRGAVLAGVLAGVLLLIEPIFAVALPLVALAFLLPHAWRDAARPVTTVATQLAAPLAFPSPRAMVNRQSGFRLAQVAVLALTALLVICPWLWRNHRVHGEWVFVKSSFGYALWQGNNPHSWGTDKIPKTSALKYARVHDGSLAGMNRALWEARHETLYIDDVLLAPGKYQEFQGLSEPARSRILQARAMAFIRDQPAAYARLCFQRLRYFLLFDETNPKAGHRVYRTSSVIWLTLAFVGAIVCAGRWWRRMWLTLSVFLVVALFHVLTIVSARFRIPVEPLSLVWAAAALGPLCTRLLVHFPSWSWRRKQQQKKAAAAAPIPAPHFKGERTRANSNARKRVRPR